MRLSADVAAVVTGGASGLGLATVQQLRAAGVKVAIFDRDEGGTLLSICRVLISPCC